VKTAVCALLAASGLAAGLAAGCTQGRDSEPTTTQPTETFTVINYVIAGEDGRTIYRTCIESRKGRRCAPGTVPPPPP
jgi:hypothetical protein